MYVRRTGMLAGAGSGSSSTKMIGIEVTLGRLATLGALCMDSGLRLAADAAEESPEIRL